MGDKVRDGAVAVLYTALGVLGKLVMLPIKFGLWLIKVTGPKGYKATQCRLRDLVESDEQIRCPSCVTKACKGCPVQNAKDVLEGADDV